jgi:hypothetical protein
MSHDDSQKNIVLIIFHYRLILRPYRLCITRVLSVFARDIYKDGMFYYYFLFQVTDVRCCISFFSSVEMIIDLLVILAELEYIEDKTIHSYFFSFWCQYRKVSCLFWLIIMLLLFIFLRRKTQIIHIGYIKWAWVKFLVFISE